MESWKREIGDDPEKFAEKARAESHCPTSEEGGSLGYLVRSACSDEFNKILFESEPEKARGPPPSSFTCVRAQPLRAHRLVHAGVRSADDAGGHPPHLRGIVPRAQAEQGAHEGQAALEWGPSERGSHGLQA